METERTPPEFRMRLESRLLFAAALLAILIALLAGHNRAIAQERTGGQALSPLSCFTRNAFISPASLGEISPSTLRRCSGMCATLSSSASKT